MSKKVKNPPDPKHQTRLKKKAAELMKTGAVCASCGSPIKYNNLLDPQGKSGCCHADILPPSDPQWGAVVNKRLSKIPPLKQTPITVPYGLAKKEKAEPKPFVPPEWLDGIRKHLACFLQAQKAEMLVYKGRSPRAGTKSGKRKGSHMFVIEPPLPMRFEGPTTFLWHGTPLSNAAGILAKSLKASFDGMLGPGVYLGTLSKAKGYMRSSEWGMLLYVEACLGNVVEAEPKGDIPRDADTLHCAAGNYRRAYGGRIRNEEWCVKNPERVVVREIHIVKC